MKYKIRNRMAVLPDDHLLPAYQREHPTYDMMFDAIYEAVGAHAPSRYFVDVGANVGDTAIVMRHNAGNPILCIEGHSRFLLYLRENVEGLNDVRIVPAFIGADELDGPVEFLSQGGTGRLVVGSKSEMEASQAPTTQSLKAILEAEGALSSGIALFKTDTDGMDAFILREFLKLDQRDAALFFECDFRQTILEERGQIAWRAVFRTLRDRGYSLLAFDNYGYQMASCSPEHYAIIMELIAYVGAQFSHQKVHVHYLDIWAFPPGMAAIFDECCRRGMASVQSVALSDAPQQGDARQDDSSRSQGSSRVHGCAIADVRARWHAKRVPFEAHDMGDDSLDDWSRFRAQMSDLQVDLSRAAKTIDEQRRIIQLLSTELAGLKKKGRQTFLQSRVGWRPTALWKSRKK